MKEPKTKHRMIRRILVGLALLALGLFIVAILTYRTSTPPFLSADGEPLPNSIAEERQIILGGVEQYVLLRGRDRTAPLLVYVHGGPGASATPFLRTYNAELENDFLMVYWDQRGAVKSFDPSLDPAGLTISRMTNDLGELIDLLLAEFGKDQVLLVGHSWGTILALEHVAAHPETVAAYIAVSQTTSQLESDTEGYEWALAEARATGETSVVSALETLGPPPYDIDGFMTQRRYINLLGGALVEPQSDFQLLRTALATSEFAWPDVLRLLRGNAFSGGVLWPEQQRYDARTRHTSIDVPFFLVLGRNDRIISPCLGAEYFDLLNAPEKEIIWFERSAHSPLFEEPEKFNEMVRQVAQSVGLLTE